MELFRFEKTSKFTKSIVKPAVPDLPLNLRPQAPKHPHAF